MNTRDRNKGLATTVAAFKHIEEGNERKAFSIFRKFKIGLTKEDISALELYSEILNGHGGMYEKMGVNISEAKEKAYEVLKKIKVPNTDNPDFKRIRLKRPE